MTKKPISADSESSLDLIYDEIKDQMAAQREYSRALDKKAELILGSSSLIITIGAGLKAMSGISSVPGSAQATEAAGTAASTLSLAIFGLAAASYLAAMIAGFRAYMVREWRKQVGPRRLREKYLALDPAKAKYRLLVNMAKAFDKNRETIRHQKVPSLKVGLVFLLLETLFLSTALMLSAW